MQINKSTGSPLLKCPITIVCLSDTHERHREIVVPEGDLLIHAGDFTMLSKRDSAIRDFNQWLGELSHPFKVICPGNHEFALEDPLQRNMIRNAKMLINEGVERGGLKIWASPATPLYGGAFGMSADHDRVKLYAQIPDDIDVLITHGPPFGILDQEPGSENHQGCRALLDRVLQLKPRLHVFGHIHGAHGTFATDETLFVNAALLGPEGDIDERPIVVRLGTN